MNVTFHEWKGMGTAHYLDGPDDDDIQVWIASVPEDESEMSAYERLLDESELSRAQRFKVLDARNEFVFARALLRLLLGADLKVAPVDITFAYGKHGKPRLADNTTEGDLRFNLAHSHSLVAVALAKGRDVGVDIEFMERAADWPLIARRVFSEGGIRELHSLPAAHQRQAFFNGWTRKEAYLKATGEGLSAEISAIEVTIVPGAPAKFLHLPGAEMETGRWEIHELPLPPGFSGALVVGNTAKM